MELVEKYVSLSKYADFEEHRKNRVFILEFFTKRKTGTLPYCADGAPGNI